MIETFQLKGGISEVNFGYTAKTEVYTNLSLDITKLSEVAGDGHEEEIICEIKRRPLESLLV